MTTINCRRTSRQGLRNRGFSIIELLMAMFILTIGMVGGIAIIATAVASNANAKFDTGAVSLAQSTMDRIIVISKDATVQTTNMTDCKGTLHPINAGLGGAPTTNIAGIGNGSTVIDFTQAPVQGYQMLYTLCAFGGGGVIGHDQVYDVRWNVSPGSTQGTWLVLVAAKNVTESGNGVSQTRFFSLPTTLRSLRGN